MKLGYKCEGVRVEEVVDIVANLTELDESDLKRKCRV